jgi:hypothetical protein
MGVLRTTFDLNGTPTLVLPVEGEESLNSRISPAISATQGKRVANFL